MKNHILFSTHNNCYLFSCRHKVGKAVCGERTGSKERQCLGSDGERGEYGRGATVEGTAGILASRRGKNGKTGKAVLPLKDPTK